MIEALSNVKGLNHTYDLKDSTGMQMASLHLLPHSEGGQYGQRTYHAAYMSMLPKAEWEVRVANSTDLIHWKFHRKILPNADMPYAYQVKENGWILLVHEQWIRTSPGPSSEAPSQLSKLYYSLGDLLLAATSTASSRHSRSARAVRWRARQAFTAQRWCSVVACSWWMQKLASTTTTRRE